MNNLSLSHLKNYLKERKIATLAELSIQFQADDELLMMMLKHFIDKGQLIQRKLTARCGTQCQQCEFKKTVVFEWLSTSASSTRLVCNP